MRAGAPTPPRFQLATVAASDTHGGGICRIGHGSQAPSERWRRRSHSPRRLHADRYGANGPRVCSASPVTNAPPSPSPPSHEPSSDGERAIHWTPASTAAPSDASPLLTSASIAVAVGYIGVRHQ